MAWTLGTPTSHVGNSDPSFSHVVAAGDDRCLVVYMTCRNGDIDGIASNQGGTFVEIGSDNLPSSANATPGVRAWRMLNPAVATHSITFSTATGNRFGGGAVTAYGINHTAPTRAPSTAGCGDAVRDRGLD